MTRGKRLSEETKKTIAMRVRNGESKSDLAKEFGLSEFTITDYARTFKSPRKVMRKIAAKPAGNGVENTGVSKLKQENEMLKRRLREVELERDVWKNQHIDWVINKA